MTRIIREVAVIYRKNIPLLSLLAGVVFISQAFSQPGFEVPLLVTDGETTWEVHFGIVPGAHFCISEADSMNSHHEFMRGPWPPACLEAWFQMPRSGVSPDCISWAGNDYRPFTAHAQRDTFRVNVYPWGNPILSVSWPAGLANYFAGLILRDVATNGGQLTVNMLTTTSVDLSGLSSPDFRIFSEGPRTLDDTISVNVQLRAGWNGTSNPFDHPVPDSLARHLFPTLLGHVFPWYNRSYLWSDVMLKGRGCYGRFPAAMTVTIRGTGHTSDSISVTSAWNLVGPIFYPVPVSAIYSIPPDIIDGGFFESVPISKVDTLWPGKAYWVKVRQSGLIVMPPGL